MKHFSEKLVKSTALGKLGLFCLAFFFEKPTGIAQIGTLNEGLNPERLSK